MSGGEGKREAVEHQYYPVNITGAATTLVKTGWGVLHTLVLNRWISGATIKLYDGIDAGGTLLGTITLESASGSNTPQSALYDIMFTAGLTIVTTGTNLDLTVCFR